MKKKGKSTNRSGQGQQVNMINPYYQKNQLFYEADQKIESNCLQPFFRTMEDIQEDEARAQASGGPQKEGTGQTIDYDLYATVVNMS